jgi:biopolymer transport protein ExbD
MMRRFLAVLVIVVAAATVLTGCHRLGLASTPAKAPAKAAAKPAAQGYTISVQNGGGVKGRGAAMVSHLQSLGFKVSAIATNAKKTTYASTLIVFRQGKDADAAKVQQALGIGAAQPSDGSIEATTDIVVVVGKDF